MTGLNIHIIFKTEVNIFDTDLEIVKDTCNQSVAKTRFDFMLFIGEKRVVLNVEFKLLQFILICLLKSLNLLLLVPFLDRLKLHYPKNIRNLNYKR